MERRGSRLSRREVVLSAAGLGLLAGCGRWPWQAQPPAKLARIGYLGLGPLYVDAFNEGLRDLGYVEGQTLTLEYRLAGQSQERLPALAAELVQLPVDLIVAAGTQAIQAAQQATDTIPIVMVAAGDPVGTGLVTSLARPGGNVTGLSTINAELSAKNLELLKEAVPTFTRVAVLWNSTNPSKELDWRETERAAAVLGVEVLSLGVHEPDDFESAFATARRARVDALITLADAFTTAHRAKILEFATTNHLPTMFAERPLVEAGGLMSYGPPYPATFRRVGYYVDRILKGAKPADLPVEQPMTFEFVVNMKTAQALGITFPNEIMLQITDVIQ